MQPLHLMNDTAKARLLHSLLREEIPAFLAYLNELTETVLNGKDPSCTNWDHQLLNVETWLELAGRIQIIMARYSRDLYRSPSVFADQLFDGYLAIFTRHALINYVYLDKPADPKFKTAIELLFT